jgi:hypothetical protein
MVRRGAYRKPVLFRFPKNLLVSFYFVLLIWPFSCTAGAAAGCCSFVATELKETIASYKPA